MHNVGKVDRIIRITLALIFVGLYFLKIQEGVWNDYLIFGSAILFFTSMRKCCPIYALLGFGTCGIPSGGKEPVVKVKNVKLK